MDERLESLLAVLQADGPLGAAALQARLGISQPVLSRTVRAAGGRLLRLGAARATRYARRQAIDPIGDAWPVYRIGADGRATRVLELIALARNQFAGRGDGPQPALGVDHDMLWPELPWFLHDARPQGFLGRAFARRIADPMGLPSNPELWTAAHTLRAWQAAGDDLPGDLVVGEAPMQRVMQRRRADPDAIDSDVRSQRYAALAAATMAGDVAGSSAAGEQPKFTCCVRDADGSLRHALVKFTQDQHSPAKRRWCDLLLAEHHALRTLEAHGHAAARSELVVAGERLCLEVTRFDRIGAHGRRGVASLRALVAEFDGAVGDPWPAVVRRLCAAAWTADADIRIVDVRWWFGRLIANTDMHQGNLSFFLDDTRPLALAPTYDMLPMGYQPATNGEIVSRRFAPELPLPEQRDAWLAASMLAIDCWQRIEGDVRVSVAFREIARDNARTVADLARTV